MKIYLVGISCVGKSTIGRLLAEYLNYSFYDLDTEVENYYQKKIDALQQEFKTMEVYRKKASIVLDLLLRRKENSVIAGCPSGMSEAYFDIYQKHKKGTDLISVHVIDNPLNILKRIKFYDKDSNPIEIKMDDRLKREYLKEIVGDYLYFGNTLVLADLQINIQDITLEKVPHLIARKLDLTDTK